MRTREEFYQKMEWEGGAAMLMGYGGSDIVDEYDLPEDFKAAWKTAAAARSVVESMLDDMEPSVDLESEDLE